ncbi:DUF998 domain-containing protein [Modestobacter roseus]|uniref:DUF998 domain-containing protein n=1 Tax=Modestobacter roseus TaxID=1181884 RepID=UPI0034DF7408
MTGAATTVASPPTAPPDDRFGAGVRAPAGLPVVYGGVVVAALAGAGTCVVGGDVVDGMLSDAVHRPSGGAWLTLCLAGLGLVALGTAVAARRALPPGSPRALVLGLLALWVTGLAAVAVFPTDLPGVGTTPAGRAHQAAAAIAMLVPVALGQVAAGLAEPRTARALRRAMAAVLGTGAVFLAMHLPVVLTGDTAVAGVGLVERVLLVAVVGTALLAATALSAPGSHGRPAAAAAVEGTPR